MVLGASARTLFSLLVGIFTLAVVALPAGAGEAGDTGPTCDALAPTIFGSNAGEWILGTEGDDVIRAGAGDDTINGLGGNDTICAGPGDDTTRAGQGNDIVRSGRGNDSSSGEAGDDSMRGQGDNDLADGGVGVDECQFETHEQCEADLAVNITGPADALRGGGEVSIYNAHLVNHGPTSAVNTRIDITLPEGALFIAGSSDSRCGALDTTTVRCSLGAMGLEAPDDAQIGLSFAGCTDPAPVDISAEANDPRTNDHVEPNTTDSVTTGLAIDPVCFPTAVNDVVTINRDSGANPIDVRANDIPGLTEFSVGSATNGAHGTVAVTNGGADVAYTPSTGYCGPDSFTYQLTPGGSQATVTVTVTCPVAVDDVVDYFCFDNQQIFVLANDSTGGGPIQISSVTQGANGSVTINPGGQSLQYQGDSQNDSFTYTISPGGSTATVTINTTCEES